MSSDQVKQKFEELEKKIREILLPPQDVWLSADEAVKYGIADEIVKVY